MKKYKLHIKRSKDVSFIKKATNKLGEVKYNKYGSKMTIVERTINSGEFIVEFENGYRVKAVSHQFNNKTLTSPYDRTKHNVGYIGEGEYDTCKIDGNHNKAYITWSGMFERCYNPKYLEKFPTYKSCIVCEEWHNYQTFCKWFYENYYTIDNERMELDKDILHKGNKIYNPENCVFISRNINTLFTKRNASRGEYPIGVHYDANKAKNGCIIAQCRDMIRDKKVHLGVFKTPEQAFNAYKTFKEKHIKEVADLYKDKIPQKLYDALYRYEVEITD